jgi:hypothetical protein
MIKACGRWEGDAYFNADRRCVDVYCLQRGSRRFFSHDDMRDLAEGKVADAQAADGVQEAA